MSACLNKVPAAGWIGRLGAFLQHNGPACVWAIGCFPIGVVGLTALSFCWGGVCAPWQWWGGVGGVLAAVWLRERSLPRLLGAGGLFLLFLAAVWLLGGLSITTCWTDLTVYHLPAIRLLVGGWNPLWVTSPEGLPGGGEVAQWEMSIWHVLSMPKAAWYFSAEAWFMTKTPLALTYPLFPFLLVSGGCSLWRYLAPYPRWLRGLALGFLWAFVPGSAGNLVDGVVALSAVGMVAEFGCCLRGATPRNWWALAGHTFWLASAKQLSLLACVLFWGLFLAGYAWRERRTLWRSLRPALCLAIGVGAVWGVVNLSPYWTSWRTFGHPLYPCYTADPERVPAHNIVGDFRDENDDAAAMGHLGRFVHAYVSQELAAAFYRWHLGKACFRPWSKTWEQTNWGVPFEGPTPLATRVLCVVSFCLLACVGGWRERLLGGMLLAGMGALPTPMIGYLRYISWYPFALILAAGALCARARAGACRWQWVAGGLLGCGLLWLMPKAVIQTGAMIDQAYAAEVLLRRGEVQTLYVPSTFFGEELRVQQQQARAQQRCLPERVNGYNVRAQCEMEPRLAETEVRYVQPEMAVESLPRFPGTSAFMLPAMRARLEAVSLFEANLAEPSRRRRMMNYPGVVIRCYGIRLPRLLWWRICSLGR